MAEFIVEIRLVDPGAAVHIPFFILFHPGFEMDQGAFPEVSEFFESFGEVEPAMVGDEQTFPVADGDEQEGLRGRAFKTGLPPIFLKNAGKGIPLFFSVF